MKLAHYADVHLGIGYSGPTPEARFNDICKVMDFMADRIIEENCDLVLFAGDMFKDARVFLDRASVEITAAVKWLRRLSGAGIPVVMISGTPSHDAVAAYELIREMRIPGIDICTNPEVINTDSASIACLPGINRSIMASKEEFSKLPTHELNQLITERINQVVHGLASECHYQPSILLSHITCAGADKAWEDLQMQQEPVLTKTAVEGAGFDLVCLGHLHNAHYVESSTPIYYCGSPERLRFDEEDNKPGFWIFEFKPGGEKTTSFIETPARKFWTLDLPWSDEDPGAVVEVLTDLKECLHPGEIEAQNTLQEIKDAIVRVRYECNEQQAKQISQSQITKDLYDLGAFYVHTVEAKIQRTNRTRAAEATSELTPARALQLWGEVNEVKRDELQELVKRNEGLEKEVGI